MEFKINNIGDERKISEFKESIEGSESSEIICAGEDLEFFYEDSNKAVPEGTPVGFDLTTTDERADFGAPIRTEVELILFNDIYWNPQY
jgi:hypothetical protein